MRTTLLAPEVAMTMPFVGAAQQQDWKVKPTEHAEDCKRPLSFKWVVVIDEQGKRRLQMRWTVAQSPIPSTVCEGTLRGIQPPRCRVIQLPARRSG